MRGYATSAVVARLVAWAEVAGAVIGVVERPFLPEPDAALAACAVDQPSLDLGLPPAPEPVVLSPVPSRLPAATSLLALG